VLDRECLGRGMRLEEIFRYARCGNSTLVNSITLQILPVTTRGEKGVMAVIDYDKGEVLFEDLLGL